MKTCTSCLEKKPFSSFSKCSRVGLQPKCKDCNRLYYLQNKERVQEVRKRYYSRTKQEHLDRAEKRRKLNPAACAATIKKYKTKKKGATPDWLTKEQLQEIEEFYWLARDLKAITGENYHVDHIVPLQGKNVSGLHVPWNLQVLPSDINLSKSNKSC